MAVPNIVQRKRGHIDLARYAGKYGGYVQRSERARCHIVPVGRRSRDWAHLCIYAIGIVGAVVIWATR